VEILRSLSLLRRETDAETSSGQANSVLWRVEESECARESLGPMLSLRRGLAIRPLNSVVRLARRIFFSTSSESLNGREIVFGEGKEERGKRRRGKRRRGEQTYQHSNFILDHSRPSCAASSTNDSRCLPSAMIGTESPQVFHFFHLSQFSLWTGRCSSIGSSGRSPQRHLVRRAR